MVPGKTDARCSKIFILNDMPLVQFRKYIFSMTIQSGSTHFYAGCSSVALLSLGTLKTAKALLIMYKKKNKKWKHARFLKILIHNNNLELVVLLLIDTRKLSQNKRNFTQKPPWNWSGEPKDLNLSLLSMMRPLQNYAWSFDVDRSRNLGVHICNSPASLFCWGKMQTLTRFEPTC